MLVVLVGVRRSALSRFAAIASTSPLLLHM
jgi:hypothetical protein